MRRDGLADTNEEQAKKASESLAKELHKVDEQLKLRTFLVGYSLTLADISIFCCLHSVF